MSDRHVFTTRMPVDEYQALRAYAFHAGVSVNVAVLQAIRAHLKAAAADEAVERRMEQARERFRDTVERLGDA